MIFLSFEVSPGKYHEYGLSFCHLFSPCILNFRFLGYFQPQVGKPALWEPESGDEHVLDDETSNGPNGVLNSALTGSKNEGQHPNWSSDSVHGMSSASDNSMSKSRYTPTVSHIKHISCELDYYNGSGDSNFLDLDWLSASDNERSKAISTPDVNISTDDGVHDVIYGITDDQAAEIQAQGLSKDFVQWVNQGETFWY
ncbi:Phosphoinositide phosphatase SAC2 [Zea mays]|uniref:Phosphoinositide phosphatase SAC2 n=1 Tax=Zea mays TaxID=4577 RepID=A0A1D6LU16_MAIZE|nr:Phosphoinositide phosphatase SAC2 [Zea mays]